METTTLNPNTNKNKCTQCDLLKLYNFVGKKWTVEIFHYITDDPVSFNELWRFNERLASPILLSRRLKEMQEFNFIKKVSKGKKIAYKITKEGKELKQIMHLLKKWGIKYNYNLPSGCKEYIDNDSK